MTSALLIQAALWLLAALALFAVTRSLKPKTLPLITPERLHADIEALENGERP